jgi:hypothetical protein
MSDILNDDKPGFVAEKPEHGFVCFGDAGNDFITGRRRGSLFSTDENIRLAHLPA